MPPCGSRTMQRRDAESRTERLLVRLLARQERLRNIRGNLSRETDAVSAKSSSEFTWHAKRTWKTASGEPRDPEGQARKEIFLAVIHQTLCLERILRVTKEGRKADYCLKSVRNFRLKLRDTMTEVIRRRLPDAPLDSDLFHYLRTSGPRCALWAYLNHLEQDIQWSDTHTLRTQLLMAW